MVAKCGELIRWHWAHRGRRVCDPWWENEGEWHRAWKRHFPLDCHEVVQHDSAGEKHIADVKLPSGLVIELQHSAMPFDEMRSREAFYGNMVWIVDAGPFRKNISIFHPLPDPAEPFVDDLVIAPPHPMWRSSRVIAHGFDGLMFFRRSEREEGSTLQLLHQGREIAEHFPRAYKGHHLFLWMRPREAWLLTTKPTYLDLGNDILGLVSRYGTRDDAIMCLKLVGKQDLVADLLG